MEQNDIVPLSESSARRDNPQEPTASSQALEEQNLDLMAAAMAVFEHGTTKFPLASGREVQVSQATMKHLAPTMKFFGHVAESLDKTQLEILVKLIGTEQTKQLLQGKRVSEIDVTDIAKNELVERAFGNVSIITALMSAMFDELPKFAALYTNLSEEEYGELGFDEGVFLVLAIFALNYHFFTRSLLPVLMGFVRSLASRKNAGNQMVGGKKSPTK